MLGTFPFSSAPYSSSETHRINEEIISLIMNLQQQENVALNIERDILSITLNINPQQDIVLDISKS